MKKILSFLLIVSLPSLSFGQAKKFYVSLPLYTYQTGGPSTGMRNQMEKQGFDDVYVSYLFGERYEDEHPLVETSMSFVAKAGYRINNRGSVYLVGGLRDQGSVEGFKSEGFYDQTIIGIRMRYSLGPKMKINYSLIQAGAGYEYSFPNSTIKLGAAASAFFFKYSMEEEKPVNYSSVIPGLSLNLRVPLGRERKLLGLEAFSDITIAPSVNMKELNADGNRFHATTTSMTMVAVGLALSLRGKN